MVTLLYFFVLLGTSEGDYREYGPYARICECQDAAASLDGYAGTPSHCYARKTYTESGGSH